MIDNSKEFNIFDFAGKMWKLRKKIILWSGIGFLVGVIIAFSIPKEYKTDVIIAPESSNTSNSMASIGALAGMMGIASGTSVDGLNQAMYPEILKSTPFLLEFYNMQVQTNDPDEIKMVYLRDYLENDIKLPWWSYLYVAPVKFIGWLFGMDKAETEQTDINSYKLTIEKRDFISALYSCISTSFDKETKTIIISSQFQDPIIAAQVADSVFSKLQLYMINYKTSKVKQEVENLQKAFDEAKLAYNNSEALYAAMQDRNKNLISKVAQIKIEELGNERNILFNSYQQISTQLELTKIKLLEETPIATVIEPAMVNEIPEKPKKKLIVIALTFLFAIGYVGIQVVKELLLQ